MPVAPFLFFNRLIPVEYANGGGKPDIDDKKNGHRSARSCLGAKFVVRPYQATLGVRLRELRWKNSAWLATAETMAGWNGFEIKNAGSGRSPVRKRSG